MTDGHGIVENPLKFGPALSPEMFSRIRRRMALEHFKWDTQIGDENVLLGEPLLMDSKSWSKLVSIAEQMATEISRIEMELLERPDLQSMLGLPDLLRRTLRSCAKPASSTAPRVLRFDFHPTTQGWKISEVNSDVPGGFTESSHFTEMVAEHFPNAQAAGNPLRAWKRAIISTSDLRHVAILYAPGYLEDQQVVYVLGAALEEEGCRVDFIQHPKRLSWREGWAYLDGLRLDVIVRFYQGEWLAELPSDSDWPRLFHQSQTIITNPGYSLLTESKRLPLLLGHLTSSARVLDEMFPQCVHPREAALDEDGWVFKPAFSNTGDDVIMPALLGRHAWERFRRQILRNSGNWIAQRRFVSLPVRAASGALLYPCVGIYTVDGKCEGAYVRLSRTPVTDYRAMEAALLITNDEESDQ